MTTLYGIKTCDTCRKARRWLEDANVEYRYHDLREHGVSPEQVQGWCDELGWEQVLNKRSTTWRDLPQDAKENLDAKGAVRLMVEQPTLIKRPILDSGGRRQLGFKDSDYADFFR